MGNNAKSQNALLYSFSFLSLVLIHSIFLRLQSQCDFLFLISLLTSPFTVKRHNKTICVYLSTPLVILYFPNKCILSFLQHFLSFFFSAF